MFKIGGTAKLAVQPKQPPPPFATSKEVFTAAQLAEGQKWYFAYCTICHSGPTNPDLPRSAYATPAKAWRSVVLDGALGRQWHGAFQGPSLRAEQAEAIRAYVLKLGAEGAAKGGR